MNVLQCEEAPFGEHEFEPDLEYDPSGATVNCSLCGLSIEEFHNAQKLDKSFFLAGHAVFTIECPDNHYTFQVKKAKSDKPLFDKPLYFVSLLTGPDNTRDFTYVGVMGKDGKLRLTGKSKFNEGTYTVRLFRRTMAVIWAGEQEKMHKKGYYVHHEGKCGRCGRRLTVPESVRSGIGPECAKHV